MTTADRREHDTGGIGDAGEMETNGMLQAGAPIEAAATLDDTAVMHVVAQAIDEAREEATPGALRALDAVAQAVEEAREIYRERYQALAQATGQITWTVPANGLADDMPSWRTYTGQSVEAVRGAGWIDAVHPDDAPRTLDDWTRAVASGTLFETEFRSRRHDGAYRDMLARGVPVIDEDDGAIREWVGFCADITDRIQVEERYRTLFETMAQGVIYQDAMGHVLSANPAAQRILGLTLDQLQGTAPIDARWKAIREDGADLPVEEQPAAVALRAGRPVRDVVMGIYHPDRDEYRWLRVTSVPLGAAGTGQPRQLYTIADDITERKRARDELERAKEAAEEANQAKSLFLANMSHELRTPLNAVIGYSEMLQEEAQDVGAADLVPDLERIHTAGKALLGLVNDVLDLSKIESGKMDLYLETFDILPMIEDVTATVGPLVAKKGNRLEVRADPVAGTMHADLTKVRQALFNLLGNAAKFTERGTIALTVSREERDGHGWLTFRVADTGIGMTTEQMGKLFQPFTQADASTTRKFGGTGLGLTITRRLCQMMGGDIAVESVPDQGSAFTITLPADVSAQQRDRDVRHAPSAPVGADTGGKRTILVVDDDPVVHDLMARYLAGEGFSAVGATDSETALRLAREMRPLAITLDVMMPRVDGWAVLTALKADPRTADIPIIMLSMVEDKNLGYALGASAYMTKPVDRARLAAVLRKYRTGRPDETVLVVEDDALTRTQVRQALEGEGCAVITAENGRAALALMEGVRPDVILLDLMMPEMDGFRFAEEVRARQEWRAIPVIVMTSKDLTTEDRYRLGGNVEEVIPKRAYTREELLREVRDLVVGHAHAGAGIASLEGTDAPPTGTDASPAPGAATTGEE